MNKKAAEKEIKQHKAKYDELLAKAIDRCQQRGDCQEVLDLLIEANNEKVKADDLEERLEIDEHAHRTTTKGRK